MTLAQPTVVGWYAAWIPAAEQRVVTRVLFCIPADGQVRCDVRGGRDGIVSLSHPSLRGARFRGPFRSPLEAQRAIDGTAPGRGRRAG